MSNPVKLWVQLMTVDSSVPCPGREDILFPLAELEAIVQRWKDRDCPGIVIDWNHQSQRFVGDTIRLTGVPAEGWITKLEAHGDGLWGYAEFGMKISARLRHMAERGERSRLYCTPALRIDANAKWGAEITSAGLTHEPLDKTLQPISGTIR